MTNDDEPYNAAMTEDLFDLWWDEVGSVLYECCDTKHVARIAWADSSDFAVSIGRAMEMANGSTSDKNP